MAGRTPRTKGTLVLRGVPVYAVDLVACRLALARRAAEGPGFDTMDQLASRAGMSRSSATKFMTGSEPTTVQIGRRMVAALGVEFDAVTSIIEPTDVSAAS